MEVLTTAARHRPLIAQRDAEGSRLVVVALCAAWCHTCTEFRAGLEALARARPDATFVWLDIEDDCEVCGDVEVDNFPTLVAFRGDAVLHYGITVPLHGVVARLVEELSGRQQGLGAVPDAVRELRASLLRLAGEAP